MDKWKSVITRTSFEFSHNMLSDTTGRYGGVLLFVLTS